MNQLVCPSCLYQNEITSERVVFCHNCHKKLPHNYTDWKQTKSEPDFKDYLNEFQLQNIEASKKITISAEVLVQKNNRPNRKDLLKFVASFVIIFFTFLCSLMWQEQLLNDGELRTDNIDYFNSVHWEKYSLGDSLTITLPFALHHNPTIISPYLTEYTHSIRSKRADASESFSVTIEEYELSTYFATNHHDFYDLQDEYVLQSKAKIQPICENERLNMKNYSVELAHNTFIANNNQYLSDNYTLVKGNKGIKIIISYLKNDKLLNKYADIVNESIYKNV